MLAPAVAIAQASQPERTVFAVRFMGEWVDDHGLRYVFSDAGGGKLTAVVSRISTGETVATMDWAPGPAGMGGPFRVPHQSPAEPASDRGITGYVDHEGQAALFVRSGRFPNGHQAEAHPDKGPGSRPHSFNLKRPNGLRAANERDWNGEWRTSRGLVSFRSDGQGMFGVIRSGEPLTTTARVALRGDTGGIAVGAWEKEGVWSSTVDRGDLWLQQSSDGKSFRGYYTEVNGSGSRRIDWTGERAAAKAESPPPAGTAPSPDQVALARAVQGQWREVSGPSLWRFTPGDQGSVTGVTWHPVDTETTGGVSFTFRPASDGKRLIATREGLRYFIEGNVLGEVHLTLEPQAGSGAGSTELVRWRPTPAQSTPPAPQTPAPPSAPAGPGPVASAGFKPLNRVDVRVDRVIVARGYPTHQVHAFVTVKNTSATPQYFTGWLKVVLADADGVSEERSQSYRATGEPAALFASTPVIQPGGELKARYIFIPEVDARLTTITLSEGGQRAEFPVSGF